MKNKSLGIIFIALLGVIVGGYSIRDGIVFHRIIFILHGISILLLSIGLFILLKFTRIITIFFSIYLMAFYTFLVYITAKNQWHFAWGVNLVAHFPTFLWSLLTLVIINTPRVKEKFNTKNNIKPEP